MTSSTATATPAATATSRPGPDARPRRKRLQVKATWQGRMKTELRVRDFAPFLVDEPARAGGDDTAPTPMEYVLAALGGCLSVTIETIAAELDVRLEGIEIEADASMDPRGFAGSADVSRHFTSTTARVRLTTPAGGAALAELTSRVESRCPAYNLLRDAGVPIVLDWSAQERHS